MSWDLSLKGKRILVTGANAGIGRLCAENLKELGAIVFRHFGPDADSAKINPHTDVMSDFSNLDQLHDFCRFVRGNLPFDGIVNNAAQKTRGNLGSASAQDFSITMQVNVLAPLMIIQAATKFSTTNSRPLSIVNIGSVNAAGGDSEQLVYSMSKGALATMTKNLANSLAEKRIRVNQLNLGWIPTDNEISLKVSEGLPIDWHTKVSKDIAPWGRLTSEQEVVNHISFWLSDLSSPANGVVYELEQFPLLGRLVPQAN